MNLNKHDLDLTPRFSENYINTREEDISRAIEFSGVPLSNHFIFALMMDSLHARKVRATLEAVLRVEEDVCACDPAYGHDDCAYCAARRLLRSENPKGPWNERTKR